MHLTILASASPSPFPNDTLAFIKPLVSSSTVLQEVLRTARALHDPPILESCTSNGLSVGATACALLLLALEAHASPPRSAPHTLVLAEQLGTALGARGAAVMARYRILVDIIEASAARVPWLTGSSATGSKRISKRSWVAKAVLDVIQFRDELERAEIAGRGGPISVDVEGENGHGGLEAASRGEDEAALDTLIAKVELNMTNSTGCVSRVPKAARATTTGPMRKNKKPRTTTSQAACFLLDPLAHLAPARTTLAHTAYLLSSDAAGESSVQPTRLQLLAVERGNAEAVHDHELFSDGELEGIVISTDEKTVEEREKRAHTMRMMWGKDDTEATRASPVVEIGGKDGKKKGKDRMDMNKLNALLDSDDPFAALGIEEWGTMEGEDPSDEDTGLISRDDEEVESEW